VKWPSGTVADKDVNSKSLSLKDNPAVHTVYSEKGRFEYTRCSVYRTWHDVHSKQYLDNHKSTQIAITITVDVKKQHKRTIYKDNTQPVTHQQQYIHDIKSMI
jgi:RNase P protein component